MTEELLKRGVEAARAGDFEKAGSYFAQVVQSDPNSELGWLYLGHCLKDQHKKRLCYEKVLKINPANLQATNALAKATGSNSVAQNRQAQLPSIPETKGQNSPLENKKAFGISATIFFGVALTFVVCMGMLFGIALLGGVFTGETSRIPISQIFLNRATSTASPTIMPASTFTSAPTITPYRSPTSVSTAEPLSFSIEDISSTDLYNNYDVAYWSQIIKQEPKNADAYYQRASSIYKVNRAIGSLELYVWKLDLALQDIDAAVALRSDFGDYYSLRGQIYAALAETEEYGVDQEYLLGLALDNAYKADELGTTIDEFPDRTVMVDLIYTNQCDKALDEVQQSIAEMQPDDVTLGGLLWIRAEAYACLGKLDDALKSINDSMLNNENMEFKSQLKVKYLILLGRYNEALPLLDEAICNCELAGWQYYWRAEIYYNTGKKKLVQNELTTGMPKTWDRGGMLPYVEAQLALDDGRTEDAIQLLQFAEATLDPTYNTLRWKIQKKLEDLGAKPVQLTTSIPYIGTPIP